MSADFRLVGIDPSPFAALFALSDAELVAHHAERHFATGNPGFPCRVSLEDAHEGEELLLLPYRHQPGASPYRACGPIFVRRGARQCMLAPGEVPGYVTRRLISVRAYDATHRMVAADVCEGTRAADAIQMQFRNELVAYIHLHNAMRGCFSCRVERA